MERYSKASGFLCKEVGVILNLGHFDPGRQEISRQLRCNNFFKAMIKELKLCTQEVGLEHTNVVLPKRSEISRFWGNNKLSVFCHSLCKQFTLVLRRCISFLDKFVEVWIVTKDALIGSIPDNLGQVMFFIRQHELLKSICRYFLTHSYQQIEVDRLFLFAHQLLVN